MPAGILINKTRQRNTKKYKMIKNKNQNFKDFNDNKGINTINNN